jgi:hypothetical protein
MTDPIFSLPSPPLPFPSLTAVRGQDVESPWRAAAVFRAVHSRTIYSLSWLPARPAEEGAEEGGEHAEGVKRRSLGKLASAGGDGFIRVFEVVRRIHLLTLHSVNQRH